MAKFTIRQASETDAPAIAPLFDAYRRFYGQLSDVAGAEQFVAARLRNRESIVFVAETTGLPELLGFTQIYPAFSSVRMTRLWILNDLYVDHTARRLGVGRALLETAATQGRANGVSHIELATQLTNSRARALYESLGYVADMEFVHLSLDLPR